MPRQIDLKSTPVSDRDFDKLHAFLRLLHNEVNQPFCIFLLHLLKFDNGPGLFHIQLHRKRRHHKGFFFLGIDII